MYFLWYLLIGLVAGWLANLIVKGSGSGLIINLIVAYRRFAGRLACVAVRLVAYGHCRHAAHLAARSYRSAAYRVAFHA